MLRYVALHGGFPNDRVRKLAWGILLSTATSSGEEVEETTYRPQDLIVPHKDTEQIERDVDRSLYFVPTARGKRGKMRLALSRVMNSIISMDPSLRYYQGYHDIVTIFLVVAGEATAFKLAKRLTHAHIRACLYPDLAPVVDVLGLLFPLIGHVDSEVHRFIQRAEVQPYFALSWMLTWYAHDFDHHARLKRLFDFFIVCHPMMPLYFAAASVCHVHVRRRLLVMEAEYALVHTFLMNLFSSKSAIFTNGSFPFESLIYETKCLYAAFPPKALCASAAKPLDETSPFIDVGGSPHFAKSVFPTCPSAALRCFLKKPAHASFAPDMAGRRERQIEYGNVWGVLPIEMELEQDEKQRKAAMYQRWKTRLVRAFIIAIAMVALVAAMWHVVGAK